MPSRRDTLRSVVDPETPEPTSRKEDYKAYSERDVDEGWPYSDEPVSEEERLQSNRPYAAEEDAAGPTDAGTDGFHAEESPARSVSDALPADEDETVRDYVEHDLDENSGASSGKTGRNSDTGRRR